VHRGAEGDVAPTRRAGRGPEDHLRHRGRFDFRRVQNQAHDAVGGRARRQAMHQQGQRGVGAWASLELLLLVVALVAVAAVALSKVLGKLLHPGQGALERERQLRATVSDLRVRHRVVGFLLFGAQ